MGIHRGEGIARVSLAAGEDVVMSQAKGDNGFCADFIAIARIFWNASTVGERTAVGVSERITETYVTPRLVLVVGERPSLWVSE